MLKGNVKRKSQEAKLTIIPTMGKALVTEWVDEELIKMKQDSNSGMLMVMVFCVPTFENVSYFSININGGRIESITAEHSVPGVPGQCSPWHSTFKCIGLGFPKLGVGLKLDAGNPTFP